MKLLLDNRRSLYKSERSYRTHKLIWDIWRWIERPHGEVGFSTEHSFWADTEMDYGEYPIDLAVMFRNLVQSTRRLEMT